MVTRMVRVCDVCESPVDDESLRFGWGNAFFETDLCKKHGEELRLTMERLVSHARKLGSPATSTTRPVKQRGPKRPSVRTKDVRDWAMRKGLEVNERGRVPESLIAKFLEAGQSS